MRDPARAVEKLPSLIRPKDHGLFLGVHPLLAVRKMMEERTGFTGLRRSRATRTMSSRLCHLENARKDCPVRKSGLKTDREAALKAIRDPWKRKMAIRELEKDFCANSSRKAKAARRNTVRRIAESAGFAVTPLDADKVKCLAASLKSAGYKSAHVYLAEAKLMHVEAGKAWSDLRARVMRQRLMAVSRGVGPRAKAPEVPRDTIQGAQLPKTWQAQRRLTDPIEIFILGMTWMLREVEIAALKKGDLLVNDTAKRVTLVLHESKKDQEARGVRRVLQRLCQGDCGWDCPYRNAKNWCTPARRSWNLMTPFAK